MKKKFSTGTKGRIDSWANECRLMIRTQSANPSLANEFIGEIQGIGKRFNVEAWQQFENLDQLKENFAEWLNPKSNG